MKMWQQRSVRLAIIAAVYSWNPALARLLLTLTMASNQSNFLCSAFLGHITYACSIARGIKGMPRGRFSEI
jgi:hypothetical protein